MQIYKSFISLPISKCIIFLVVKSPRFHKTDTEQFTNIQINCVCLRNCTVNHTDCNGIEIFIQYNWQFVVLKAICQLDYDSQHVPINPYDFRASIN